MGLVLVLLLGEVWESELRGLLDIRIGGASTWGGQLVSQQRI